MKTNNKNNNLFEKLVLLFAILIVVFCGIWYSGRKTALEYTFTDSEQDNTIFDEYNQKITSKKEKNLEPEETAESSVPEETKNLTNEVDNQENNDKININTASLDLLDTLPGIGKALAEDIIDYRTKHGGFKTIEEIKNVSRIGEKTFDKLKDKISVS